MTVAHRGRGDAPTGSGARAVDGAGIVLEQRAGKLALRALVAAQTMRGALDIVDADGARIEVRLRADNRDRRLAVGMTAYVLLPVS